MNTKEINRHGKGQGQSEFEQTFLYGMGLR